MKQNVLLIEFNRELGGSIRSILAFGEQLQKKGYNPILVIPKVNTWEQEAINSEIKYYKVNTYPWVKRVEDKTTFIKKIKKNVKDYINFLAELKLYSIIKKEKINIVHINTVNYGVGIWAARQLHKPVVWHIREFLEEDHGTEFIDKEYSIKCIEKSECIIAISNSVCSKYSKSLKNSKINLVYNGLDEDIYLDELKTILDNKTTVVALIGRVTEGKGQLELLTALCILVKRGYSDIIVWIVGNGDEEYLKRLNDYVLKSKIEQYVKFCGFQRDVRHILSQTDIVCVCSKNEAFGRVTVEAMLAGNLVIGSNTAGTEEIISNKQTGLLYEQGNAIKLADTIEYALDNKKDMKRIAYAGREHARQCYTVTKNANEIVALYEEVR